MEKILVAYYSQTGQLNDILFKFMEPWMGKYDVEFCRIFADDYTFPLTWWKFFAAFPDSVNNKTCKIRFEIKSSDYACVILGFQPWFVHTSVPFRSFMRTIEFANVVNNKPVICVVNSRNSWRNSLNEVEKQIQEKTGIILGKFVFRDTSKNLKGLLALFKWLFTGKKQSRDSISGGISTEIIRNADEYGMMALELLKNKSFLYTLIPPAHKEFTSIGYEKYAINKYEKWGKFVQSKYRLVQNFKMIIFQFWLIFTLLFLSKKIAKKNNINIV